MAIKIAGAEIAFILAAGGEIQHLTLSFPTRAAADSVMQTVQSSERGWIKIADDNRITMIAVKNIITVSLVDFTQPAAPRTEER